ncbi:MAG: hypothetical protein JWQ03_518 [Variovorax sp.]|nr:hypothetical protein [Variovorax sp.]
MLNTGGGLPENTATNLALQAGIWNPATNKWTQGSAETKGREYHSIALLLPDATVLVAGGGAPGPVNQLNAEIYYPPYLYAKDGSETRLSRPVIKSAPQDMTMGSTYNMTVTSQKAIKRVTLVRTGSVTHSVNVDQRFLEVPFVQSGTNLQVNVNETNNVLPPGYYMVIAIDTVGVPTVAKIVRIGIRLA